MTQVNTAKSEFAKGRDGNNYKITGDGKVKNLDPFANLKDIVSKAELDAGSLMKSIYHYLKDNDEDVSQKKSWVNCRGYRMGFEEHGFTIKDMQNYGEYVEDWDNPFPTPREVHEFLLKPKSLRKTNRVDPKKTRDKVSKVKHVEVDPLAKEFESTHPGKKAIWLGKETSAFIHWKETKDEPKEEEVTLESLEKLRATALRKIKATKKVKNLQELKGFIPHRSYNVHFGKLIKKFNSNKIRAKVFKQKLIELTEEIDFTPRRKPAPKFHGLIWYDISLLWEHDDLIKFSTAKGETLSFHRTEFICRYLLSIEPKCMVQLMNHLRGEISIQEFIDNPIKKDRFVAYDDRLLRSCKDLDLYKAIENLLFDWEIPNPNLLAYQNDAPELKKGMDVVVYFPCIYSRFFGKVAVIDEGIKIRYEDGEVEPLIKNQRWELQD